MLLVLSDRCRSKHDNDNIIPGTWYAVVLTMYTHPFVSLDNLKQAGLHMAISLLHLNDVHEGIVVGRSIAADIDQVIHPFGYCCYS